MMKQPWFRDTDTKEKTGSRAERGGDEDVEARFVSYKGGEAQE